ncbi:MAG: hypothetical protein MI723_02035, partial [Caulobacterales bacterium]|nr:hypothetical protein [Caulobacterales bacterium]
MPEPAPKRWLSRQHVLVAAAALLSVAALTSLTILLEMLPARIADTAHQANGLHRLQARILTANHERSLALVMAVETGRPEWIRRYEANARVQEALLSETVSAATSAEAARAAAVAVLARQSMKLTENAIIAWARRGELDRSRAWLRDPDFSTSEFAFDKAMAAFATTSWAQVERREADVARSAMFLVNAVAVAVAVLIVIWTVVLRDVTRAMGELRGARDGLSSAHAELRRKSRLKEASYFEDSPIPMFEASLPTVAALFDRLRLQNGDLKEWMEANPREMRRMILRLRPMRANRAALELLDAPDLAFVNDNVRRFFTAEFTEAVQAFLLSVWRGETEFLRECPFRTLGRRRIDALVHARVARGARDSLE